MDAFVPFHRPSLGRAEERGVVRALRSGWLTSGPEGAAFEREFAAATGAGDAIAVASGTAALELALAGLGVNPGDRVVVPTLTFAATGEVVWRLGARAVLADVNPRTLNLGASELERALAGGGIRAVVPVHFGGRPCDLPALRRVTRAAGCALVGDAAHAFGAQFRGRPLAREAACYSFYATKNITTGEGGMITTDSAPLGRRLRRLRLHGLEGYGRSGSPLYDIAELGFKANLPDLAAAIGRAQLRRADGFLRARRRLAAFYTAAFAADAATGEALETPPDESGHAWHLYTIQLRLERLRISRDRFWAELRQRGIGTSVHFKPLHRHSFYRRAGFRSADFPAADAVFPRLLSLPLYPALDRAAAERVAAAVAAVVRRYRR